jgi:hypothetical protein
MNDVMSSSVDIELNANAGSAAAGIAALHTTSERAHKMGNRWVTLAKNNEIFMRAFVYRKFATLPDERIRKRALCHKSKAKKNGSKEPFRLKRMPDAYLPRIDTTLSAPGAPNACCLRTCN